MIAVVWLGAVWCGGLLLLLYAALRVFEWRMLYPPVQSAKEDPSRMGLLFQEVRFMAEDGVALHGWWIPSDHARGAVVYCHGNAESIGDLLAIAQRLNHLHIQVLLFDYRGYGQSRGVPSEQGTYRDARAAYEVVRAQYGDLDAPPVVVMGRSLGSAVAAQLALDKPVRGVILESAFTSAGDMARRLVPALARLDRLLRYRYDTRKKIGRLRAPVLIAHSPEDELVPVAMGKALYAAAPSPKTWVELSGGHNDGGGSRRPAYDAALDRFFREVFAPGAPAAMVRE